MIDILVPGPVEAYYVGHIFSREIGRERERDRDRAVEGRGGGGRQTD